MYLLPFLLDIPKAKFIQREKPGQKKKKIILSRIFDSHSKRWKFSVRNEERSRKAAISHEDVSGKS